MWEICPSLIKQDVTERTSPELILAGLNATQALQASAKVTGKPFEKPIKNFYQTDPISRA
jgi:NADH dehydrogenase (ubiquinone) Fe-S protein 1